MLWEIRFWLVEKIIVLQLQLLVFYVLPWSQVMKDLSLSYVSIINLLHFVSFHGFLRDDVSSFQCKINVSIFLIDLSFFAYVNFTFSLSASDISINILRLLPLGKITISIETNESITILKMALILICTVEAVQKRFDICCSLLPI